MTAKNRQTRLRMRCIRLATLEPQYQILRITAVKKLVWNEVIFSGGNDADEVKQLSKAVTDAFLQKGIIPEGEKVILGSAFHNLCWSFKNYVGVTEHAEFAETLPADCAELAGHEARAQVIFDTLCEISKNTGFGFIVNYCCMEDFCDSGISIPLGNVHFHPELIFDGRRLIDDFPDVSLNRTYFHLWHGFLADRNVRDRTLLDEILSHKEGLSYWKTFSDEVLLQKGLLYFDQAEQAICARMLDSLNGYFQVDYTTDETCGLSKQDGGGFPTTCGTRFLHGSKK